ncbi:hypothetical protein V8F33_007841 [Rhypophila sp. PSN 637]
MEGRILGTSPDSPPPFGLYLVAVMQWDDRNTVADPLEVTYRSATERQRCLDSVYEWVEAHPFEPFKHQGLRGTQDHNVKVYDLPVPAEEALRTWREHYKRHQWAKEKLAALALNLTGGEQTNEDQNQSEQSDQSSQTESDMASGGGNEEPPPDTQVNRTAMLPKPLQPVYTTPPAPAPWTFLPPTMDAPESSRTSSPAVPVTPSSTPIPREFIPTNHASTTSLPTNPFTQSTVSTAASAPSLSGAGQFTSSTTPNPIPGEFIPTSHASTPTNPFTPTKTSPTPSSVPGLNNNTGIFTPPQTSLPSSSPSLLAAIKPPPERLLISSKNVQMVGCVSRYFVCNAPGFTPNSTPTKRKATDDLRAWDPSGMNFQFGPPPRGGKGAGAEFGSSLFPLSGVVG